MRAGRPVRRQEARGPVRDFGRLRRLRDVARKLGAFVRRVFERIGFGMIRDVFRAKISRRVIDADPAFDMKHRRALGEAGGRDVIAERIARPGNLAWRGRDREFGLQHLLVAIVARPQHHAMLAERDRLPVAIGRDVPDGEMALGPACRTSVAVQKSASFCGEFIMRTSEPVSFVPNSYTRVLHDETNFGMDTSGSTHLASKRH